MNKIYRLVALPRELTRIDALLMARRIPFQVILSIYCAVTEAYIAGGVLDIAAAMALVPSSGTANASTLYSRANAPAVSFLACELGLSTIYGCGPHSA